MLIAVILPEDTDTEALVENQSWRLIFGLPILTYLLILIWLVCFLPYDSPKFHMQKGERHLAIKSIHKVYNTQGNYHRALKIYNHIRLTSAN